MSCEIENGSPVSIGNIKLSVDAGTATLANVRFYNEVGDRIQARNSGAAVDLTVTTTPKTIAELYEAAVGAGEPFAKRFANDNYAVGIMSDPVSGAVVNVFVNSRVTDVKDKTIAIGTVFVWGIMPQEIWPYGGALASGSSSSSSTMLAKRKDSAGSLALADGDFAPLQLDAEGWARTVAKGQAVVGLGAEGVGGFTTGGRAANVERSPVDHTSWVSFTTTLNGRQVVQPYALPVQTWSGMLTFAAASHASTALKAAGGAGKYHYVNSIMISDIGGAAFPTGAHVSIKDGSTEIIALAIGQTITFPTPLRFSENTAIMVDPSAGVDIKVSMVGYTAGE